MLRHIEPAAPKPAGAEEPAAPKPEWAKAGWFCGRSDGPGWRGRPDIAGRRRQFRGWFFIIAVWLAVAVAQGSAWFFQWIAGPSAIASGGLRIPLMLLVAACVVLAVTLLVRNVGSPLGDVVTASDRVAAGDFTVRIREHGAPWIRSVARAFNSMTSSLEVQHRQRRELMADVAHELRTPLTAMQGRLEGIVDGVYAADTTHVQQVLDDTRMLARLVEDLRTLAHSESGTLTLQCEPTDMGTLVQDVLAMFRAGASDADVRFSVHIPASVPLLDIDPVRIREVLANLISNALRYSPQGGTVAVDVEPVTSAMILRVSDDGPGIPAADLRHIFDRFYKGTTSSGSGLGLTIARNLMAAHGGTLTAANRSEGGTVFSATLPIVNSES
jgi:signal transduction histidine kinase